MWKELFSTDLDELAQYAEVGLKFFASDEHYEEASNVYLARQLVNKAGKQRLFLFDDGEKQMIFGAKYSDSYPNPYTKEKGMWKVIDLAYLGDWKDIDVVKFGCDAVRKWLDKNGIKQWYVIFNMDTKKLDTLPPDLVAQKRIFLQFLNDVQKECWEITETLPFADSTHFVAHFNREKK
jgi:hypothetical protein